MDIFYHHVPDDNTPLEETMGALATAVTSGKALYVGISNYNGAKMAECAEILDGIPQDSRIVADGRFLRSDSVNDLYLKKVQALNALAKERGQTLAEMSLAWILRDDV